MISETTDVRSNPKEQIHHIAEVIGSSPARRKVFEEIHRGKKRIKTASEISQNIKLPKIRVEQEAGVLYKNRIIRKTTFNKEIAYEKDDFSQQHKEEILRLAGNKKALSKYPTKWNPNIRLPNDKIVSLNLALTRNTINIRQLTIDDIDSFCKVKTTLKNINKEPILERDFKNGLQKILNEEGEFKDWGGETDDLFSTRLIMSGRRFSVAFGLKGRGTSGKLVPRKMGTQADQIQRLFSDPADIFLVQYCGQIDRSIIVQMEAFAIAKSVLMNKRIYYGIIDGQDTSRIIEAYKEFFT